MDLTKIFKVDAQGKGTIAVIIAALVVMAFAAPLNLKPLMDMAWTALWIGAGLSFLYILLRFGKPWLQQ